MIDMRIEGESLNAAVSDGYGTYMAGNITYIGGFEVGTYLCYDDIDLTGVKSIDVAYARNAADVSSAGRFVVLWGGSDFETATNLGEKLTSTTNGWETFQNINVGLGQTVNEAGRLCFRGLQGNGIMNIDSFTLRATEGQNNGVTSFDLELPVGPAVPAISVRDNQVLFDDEVRSIAGNSLFWSNGKYSADIWYSAEVVTALKNDWNSQIVRAAMAVDDTKPGGTTSVADLGGYLTLPFENKFNVTKVVNAAIENEMYVIIDWHAHKAEDNKQQAIEFFREMAATYGEFNNVIYEIYNEPVDTSWPQIKAYAEDVIAAIRAEDPDNLIIVGTRYYSQEVEEAANSPITNFSNIAYTLHFYAGTHRGDLRDKAKRALDKGIALFVTEWGTVGADGQTGFDANETNLWMAFLKQNNISHVNWAISDLAQGSAALRRGADIDGQWNEAQLTESGKLVKGIIQNW